jgi:hypothetical protein
VSRVNTIGSYFLEFKWKVGKYPTGQDVEGYRILPNHELPKPSIDVLSSHGLFILLIAVFFNEMQLTQYSSIPLFQLRSEAELSSP